MIAPLKPASPGSSPCKICGGDAPLYGVVDFNRSCEEARGTFLPLAGVAVYYRRCGSCGFLFSDAFDDWAAADFQRFIYNDAYLAIDPDFTETRPASSAGLIAQQFERDRARLRVLDYGGGNGRMAALLRERGFAAAETYDPFTPAFARLPDGGGFEIVSSFETVEHLPDPNAGFAAMARLVAEPGLVLFSTLVQPADFATRQMGWWYIGPRNGHISLFTRQALAVAWRRHGFTVGSFNDNLHVAFRSPPDFARHLFPAG